MSTSSIMTLFGEPSRPSRYPSSFAISALLHAGVFSLMTIHLIQTHSVIERFPVTRFAVRYVDFHSTEPQARQADGSAIPYPGPASAARADSQPSPQKVNTAAQGGSIAGSPTVTRLTPKRMPAPQTLIQPDIAHLLTLPQKSTVPLVVLWTPDKTTVRNVVPALPDKASIAVVHPSLEMPIEEENLADLRLSSSAFVTPGPAVPPSTTSPIVVHGPEELKRVPETSSKQAEAPTPGRIVSLSDVRVAEGKVVVPVADQSAKATPGILIPGQLKDPAPAGNGVSTTKLNGAGTGKGTGDHAGNKPDSSAKPGASADHPGAGTETAKAEKGTPGPVAGDHGIKQPAPSHAGTPAATQPAISSPSQNMAQKNIAQNSSQTGAPAAPAQGATTGSGVGIQPSAVHISLPRDGQFGVVVYGASIPDKYPETAELWSGRMASTVYLHVGLAKSWILQYAQPRLSDATGGAHIDAPWPYEIARPHLDPSDVDADAVILHGYVNKDGRFEKLEVVFPPQLPKASTWLGVLNQWQFRPAKVNGQPAPVEILLIVPDQLD